MLPPDNEKVLSTPTELKKFGILLAVVELFCMIFYGFTADYDSETKDNFRYNLWADVNIMAFIGFGLLMTFHKQYFYSAVGYTLMIGAVSFQYYPIWQLIWQYAWEKDQMNFRMKLNTYTLVCSSFCTDSILIAFGAIIGKVTPFQLLILTIAQTIGFSLNERIGLEMGITDIGGSMYIHLFGAVCGLVISKIITKPEAFNHPHAKSNYISDLTSVVGTLFLWMYWPSFNAAGTDDNSVSQNRSYINTVLSLTGSVFATFIVSFLMRKERKINMIDIQNATLAGGVAMGTCADIHIEPAYSIAIGVIAGFVSIYCYAKLQGILEKKIKLHDSCGVLNLHGLPGLLGAFFGVFACLATHKQFDKNNPIDIKLLKEVFSKADQPWWTLEKQALIQFEYLLISFGISILTGLFCGLLIYYLGNPPQLLFDDNENFRIPSVHYEEADRFYNKIQILLQQQNYGNNAITKEDGEESFKKQLFQNLLNSDDKKQQSSINDNKVKDNLTDLQ